MNDIRTNLVDYLRGRGWKAPENPGPEAGLWSRDGSPFYVPVPHRVDTDAPDWPFILERIAKIERVPVTEVERALAFPTIDIIDLRAASAVIGDTIPFKSGVALAQSGWTMFRSCATTATGVKAQIKGNYRRSGDEIIESARMAQTRRGSYILPIHVPLSKAPEPVTDTHFEGMEMALPDPPERRVTRTMALALSSFAKIVVETDRPPTGDAVHELITAGVSKEFVASLHKILDADAVQEFSADFQWAKIEGSEAPALSGRVEVPASAAKLAEITAETLGRMSESSVQESLTGTVVGVFRARDSGGRITIDTYRNGRPAHVHVNVSNDGLNRALDWMKRKDTVVTQGTVRRVGDGLQANGIDNIRTLY